MEQLGFMIIRAYEEAEEEARAIREMVRSNKEGTRHDTHSPSPTAHWLDKEKQITFKTFMEAGVDLNAIIANCFPKEGPEPIHQPLRPILFQCDEVGTSLYRAHPNSDSISIFRPIGCDVGPENGMFMVYPCSDNLDMKDVQGPPKSIRINSGELLVIRGPTIVKTVNTGGGLVMWKGCSIQPTGMNIVGQHVLPFMRARPPNVTMVDR
ncbi:hypothetical protein BDV36DRAFT_247929 [Aspergillus pseudocaelatus]|uniref:Uncharacterized protein n=1 Tax=Aspergillus pseudocaelatus TaxID=1825620 RepID=A0ABQ6WWJ6_9EURO|nr:hypothetical protein BDV36DRAFT_247929 [Aspergillus pseudocaelatus]